MTKWKYLPRRQQQKAQREPRSEQPIEHYMKHRAQLPTPPSRRTSYQLPNFYTPDALGLD